MIRVGPYPLEEMQCLFPKHYKEIVQAGLLTSSFYQPPSHLVKDSGFRLKPHKGSDLQRWARLRIPRSSLLCFKQAPEQCIVGTDSIKAGRFCQYSAVKLNVLALFFRWPDFKNIYEKSLDK